MRKTSIGGQAVMEGVMMKSMDNMAVAVRRTDGQIAVQDRKLAPWTKKNRFFGLPFVRGAVNLADTMTLGMKVLTDSAMMAGLEEEEPTKFEKWLAKKTGKSALDVMMPMAIVMAVLLSIGLYIVLPALCAKGFQMFIQSGVVVNLLEGVVRMLILVGYLAAISQMKDIRRLLGYHGAEHKTIACYEAGLELTPENARNMSRLHPRCGTSFLFLVMLISLFIFICFGSIESILLRVLTRILMIPLVAAVSYEALKALARDDSKLAAFIKKPGLWMQKFTTREPDDEMLEVAIAAFKRVLEMDEEDEARRNGTLNETAEETAESEPADETAQGADESAEDAAKEPDAPTETETTEAVGETEETEETAQDGDAQA